MKKVLFISHEASRTGAPFVLFHLMKWMKTHHPEVQTHLLLLKGGEFTDSFSKVTNKTFDLAKGFADFRKSIPYFFCKIKHLADKSNSPEKYFENNLITTLAKENYDIIYANTVLSIPFASKIKKRQHRQPSLIVHIHELNAMIDMALPDFDQFIPDINKFIAVSNSVKDNLVTNRRIPSDKITVIYEFSSTEQPDINAETIRAKDWFEVGGAGAVQLRKGFDLFIQTAFHVKQKAPDALIKFRWIGDIPASYNALIKEDLEKTGLDQMVIFEGASANPHSYFKNFDVFLLTSREDPFPLVCIEAGMMGLPVICFNKGNGTAEVLNQGGGKLVPYLDTAALADAILHYYNHPEIRKNDGKKAAELFSEFTPEKICPKIYSLLKI